MDGCVSRSAGPGACSTTVTYPDARPTRVVRIVELVRVVGQHVQPAHFAVDVVPFRVADRVPYARQPVGDQRERGHQQQQHGRSVLRVPVDLARHTDQPQQPGGLQQPDERGGLLTYEKNKTIATDAHVSMSDFKPAHLWPGNSKSRRKLKRINK